MPWEWFHLLLKNIIPNLVDFWTGNFKGLGVGTEEFKIEPHIWEEVGRETAAVVRDMLTTFVHVLSNITHDQSLFTAKSWGFWFGYLAPKLLQGRFWRNKYHKHMCELGDIMKVMLQFQTTVAQVEEIKQRLIDWVRRYERYV